MQLKKTTDYAFRCVLYLSGCQRPRNSETISQEATIPVSVVKRIMPCLCKAGITERVSGKEMGYILAKSPEKIFPYDIVRLFEETTCINHCLEKDGVCDRNGIETGCPMHQFLKRIQKQQDEQMKSISFRELYEETTEYKEKMKKPITL